MARAPIINKLPVGTSYKQYAALSELAFGAVVLDTAWVLDSGPYRNVCLAAGADPRLIASGSIKKATPL
jgi:hypothetical protein